MSKAINKVIYNGNTLIDLTPTTVDASKILNGYGCYGADGNWINGVLDLGGTSQAYPYMYLEEIIPEQELTAVEQSNGQWRISIDDNTGDIENGTNYLIICDGKKYYFTCYGKNVRYLDWHKSADDVHIRIFEIMQNSTELYFYIESGYISDGGSPTHTIQVFKVITNENPDITYGRSIIKDSLVHFDDALPAPFEHVKGDFDIVQNLHGYSQSWFGGLGRNIANISLSTIKALTTDTSQFDWTSTNICVHKGLTFTINEDEDGNFVSFTVQGQPIGDVNFPLGTIDLVNGTTYYKSATATDTNKNGDFIVNDTNLLRYSGHVVSWACDITTTKTMQWYQTGTTDIYDNTYYPMIRTVGDTTYEYEPYENICPIKHYDEIKIRHTANSNFNVYNTYRINWSNKDKYPVGSGTFDLTTGKIILDHAFLTPDVVDKESWTIGGSYVYHSRTFNNSNLVFKANEDYYCNCLYNTRLSGAGWSGMTSRPEGSCHISTDFYFGKPSSVSTSDDFKRWYREHNIEVLIELETPIEIQLTPIEITAFVGNNYLDCSVGHLEIAYKTVFTSDLADHASADYAYLIE